MPPPKKLTSVGVSDEEIEQKFRKCLEQFGVSDETQLNQVPVAAIRSLLRLLDNARAEACPHKRRKKR